MSIVNTPVNTTTTIVTLPAGSTRTGLDQIISLITNDPGLLKKVSATDLASGAAAADAMNGLIVPLALPTTATSPQVMYATSTRGCAPTI